MSPLKRSNNFAARMGRWSANHWKTAVFGWLAFVIAAFVIGNTVGVKYLDATDANIGEARKGDKIIAAGFPKHEDEQGEIVLVQSKNLTADDSAFKATVDDVARTLDAFPQVDELQSPYDPDHADQISHDRHSAMVTFRPQGHVRRGPHLHRRRSAPRSTRSSRGTTGLLRRASSAASPTEKALQAAINGMLAKAGHDRAPARAPDPAVRVRLGRCGRRAAAARDHGRLRDEFGLIALPSQFIPMDEQIAEVILLIGLAVGVDYSLFYLRREREERRAGRSERAALEAAAATSGRAVLISGITVIIAMAGMLLSGDKTFMSFSIGTMMVVAVAMIGSLTVLPAMLSRLGDKRREGPDPVPAPAPQQERRGSRFWGAILEPRPAPPGRLGRRRRRRCSSRSPPRRCTLHTADSGLDGHAEEPPSWPLPRVDNAFPGGAARPCRNQGRRVTRRRSRTRSPT